MIEIAILGFGVVGGGTVNLLESHKESIKQKIGEEVHVKYILDIRDMPDSPYADRLTKDYSVILSDPEVKIVAELIGGSHPAFEFSMSALKAGKHVVTSNKEVVANFGDELLATAAANGVQYLFEASVGGGVPIIRPLTTDLAANDIRSISGIVNGTTNYILYRMLEGGIDFDTALAEAKAKGYAEADPSADVEGLDACRKICILTAVTYGKLVPPASVHTEGITNIRPEDVRAAALFDSDIKLLARAVRDGNGDLFMMVAPFFVSRSCPLAHVSDVFNGIMVSGSAVGDVMFYGRGAGALPTASAVCSDILSLAHKDTPATLTFERDEHFAADFSFFSSRHYLALTGIDENAARVILGDVTVLSGIGEELLLVTEETSENALDDARRRLESCGAKVVSHIRVFA